MSKIKKVKKKIQYFEIDIQYLDSFKSDDDNPFRDLFSAIVKIVKSRDSSRYQNFGDKEIFIQDIVFFPEEKVINGKLRSIKKDIFPEIINTDTDELRDIDAAEDEGLVETTHFVIDYSSKKAKLALEHNLYGAKITDFSTYIQNIGIKKSIVEKVTFYPIVKEQLSSFQRRMKRCSEVVVKVHKDYIKNIESMDSGLATALAIAESQFEGEYLSVSVKYDYQKKAATTKANNLANKLISIFSKDKSKTNFFEKLTFKAEDEDRNNKLTVFNLLMGKVESDIDVERRERSKSLVSIDMFTKMRTEMRSKKL